MAIEVRVSVRESDSGELVYVIQCIILYIYIIIYNIYILYRRLLRLEFGIKNSGWLSANLRVFFSEERFKHVLTNQSVICNGL